MIFLWLACTSTVELTEGAGNPFYSEPPTIESVSFDCDPEQSNWSFDVFTEHWTGGGRLWIAKTIDLVERHRMTSKEAAADGSSDHLSLKVGIEPDWRDASPDKTTRWLCRDVTDLTFSIVVYDPTGSEIKDCRTWGADTEIWTQIDGTFACETAIELPIDTGDSNR